MFKKMIVTELGEAAVQEQQLISITTLIVIDWRRY